MHQLQPLRDWIQSLNLGKTSIASARQDRNKTKHAKILSAMDTKDTLFATQIKMKLERFDELTIWEQTYVVRKLRGSFKVYPLGCEGRGRVGDGIRVELQGKKCTNGLTTPNLYIPSAALILQRICTISGTVSTQMRSCIWDIPLEELRPMTGDHLLWKDRIQDELLSHTSSCLFGIVHLHLRHLKGQTDGYLAMINHTRALRLNSWCKGSLEKPEDTSPVDFHYAPRLCDAISIFRHGWKGKRAIPGLHYRKFSHEYITHGVFGYPETDILQHISWADLVSAGIFDLLPMLRAQCLERPSGLYTTLRKIRIQNYQRVTFFKITENEMVAAVELARLQTRPAEEESDDTHRPHLWALLNFLTFRKRCSGDELLQQTIRKFGYTRNDLDEGLYDEFERLPSNLPELHSLYHLAVDVQSVVGGQPLSPLVQVRTYTRNPQSQQHMQRDDAEYEKTRRPTLTYNADGYEIEKKCGLACNCNIWVKTSKRKINHGLEDDQSEDEEDDANGHDGEGYDDDGNDKRGLTEMLERATKRPRTSDEPCDAESEVLYEARYQTIPRV
ncbi:hypothetical protein E4T39_06732 [Aureobasidium subglaciale]|nr:hypothetical protein E4T39_06732 [Aureobasidium subglaciale]